MAEKRRIPETLFDDIGIRMTYEVERVIYELQTEHQHLVLFERAVRLGHRSEQDESLREQLAHFLHGQHERTIAR